MHCPAVPEAPDKMAVDDLTKFLALSKMATSESPKLPASSNLAHPIILMLPMLHVAWRHNLGMIKLHR